MLGADQTITVVHCDDEGYTCTPINGVSVFSKVEHTVSDKGILAAEVVKIRIPLAAVPEPLPEAGDFVVFAPVESIEGRADLERYDYASIVGVGDNRRGRLPHIRLVCK